MAKKVYLGVGHGGADPGAVFDGIKEKELNLNIALACRKQRNFVLDKGDIFTSLERKRLWRG